ncbi:MAG TPA: hypothetical protein DCP37_01205 [Dehalococcoidia bacterium]|nr:hypothetical protein [SAR202 cluster bacterium]MDP6800097.1 hypothetical protein [SAR202 cluster bacterium]HAL46351.1 hypothetical protein [Dehalococcoidia bacterium]
MVYRFQHLRVPLALVALVLLTISLWLMLGGCGGGAEAFSAGRAPGAGWAVPVADDMPADQSDWTAAAQLNARWSAGDDAAAGVDAMQFIKDAGQTVLRLSRMEVASSWRRTSHVRSPRADLRSRADVRRFVFSINSDMKRAMSRL